MSPENKKPSALALEAALRAFAETLGETATLGHARIVLMAAGSGPDGMDQAAIGQRLGWSQSSCIRAIRSLSARSWERGDDGKYKEGLGLVKSEHDPEDFRRRLISLTETGRAFMKKVVS